MRRLVGSVATLSFLLVGCSDARIAVTGVFLAAGNECISTIAFFNERGEQVAVAGVEVEHQSFDPSTPGTGEPFCMVSGRYSVELPPAEVYEARVGDFRVFQAVMTREDLRENEFEWRIDAAGM